MIKLRKMKQLILTAAITAAIGFTSVSFAVCNCIPERNEEYTMEEAAKGSPEGQELELRTQISNNENVSAALTEKELESVPADVNIGEVAAADVTSTEALTALGKATTTAAEEAALESAKTTLTTMAEGASAVMGPLTMGAMLVYSVYNITDVFADPNSTEWERANSVLINIPPVAVGELVYALGNMIYKSIKAKEERRNAYIRATEHSGKVNALSKYDISELEREGFIYTENNTQKTFGDYVLKHTKKETYDIIAEPQLTRYNKLIPRSEAQLLRLYSIKIIAADTADSAALLVLKANVLLENAKAAVKNDSNTKTINDVADAEQVLESAKEAVTIAYLDK